MSKAKAITTTLPDGRTEVQMPGGSGSGPEVEAIRAHARELREDNERREKLKQKQLLRVKRMR